MLAGVSEFYYFTMLVSRNFVYIFRIPIIKD